MKEDSDLIRLTPQHLKEIRDTGVTFMFINGCVRKVTKEDLRFKKEELEEFVLKRKAE